MLGTAVQEGSSSLSNEMYSSLLMHYLQGVEQSKLLEKLAAEGVDDGLAARELAKIESDPLASEARRKIQLCHKLESMANAKVALAGLSSANSKIPRVASLSREDFLTDYYSRNLPVIFTGITSRWKALTRWTPEYLGQLLGKERIQVMIGRDSDPLYARNPEKHKREILFQDYLDRITSVSGNDVYMVAVNHFMYRPCAAPLFEDMDVFPEYLTAERPCGDLWLGPEGTFTPLHHDRMNVLFVQVKGRKQFTLISPDYTHLLRNHVGIFSEFNPEAPDINQDPSSQQIAKLSFILNPGEVLFIPVGWWHCVRSLDLSMSVSFANFVFPNKYAIYQPNWGTGPGKRRM